MTVIAQYEEHIWDSGIVTNEPTYETEGEKLYCCIVCDATMTETIPKLIPDQVPITFIKISIGGSDVPSTLSLARNSTLQFDVLLNEGVSGGDLVWSVSDRSFATTDTTGRVTTLNKSGMVVVTVTDPATGISQSTILRIT